MASDLDKAKKIVARRKSYVGSHDTLRKNIAAAVVDGIALGRVEGLELAAKAIADEIKRLKNA